MKVCGHHGGRNPKAIARRDRDAITATAAALVASQEIEPTADPVASLLRVSGEMEALSTALRDKVGELQNLTVTDRLGSQDIAALLGAYMTALERSGRILVSINRLSLEERRYRPSKEKGKVLAEIVMRAVRSDTADIDWQTQIRVQQAIGEEVEAAIANGEFADE